jgi:hypothetical protein
MEESRAHSTRSDTLSLFELLASRCFSGDFHTPPRNSHFSGLFCDFSLRSPIPLAIVHCGSSFFADKQG